jgi:hypothetical protein
VASIVSGLLIGHILFPPNGFLSILFHLHKNASNIGKLLSSQVSSGFVSNPYRL